ncbi:MAG: class I SAM-dependent methyltransferase [Anaerolineae bacterium]|uniref:class I SAM-dependent methyltransferase n=1 Tax=Promineifilum sp. TaxID=2664178 RepID=UPI001E14FA94|nr:class I SAM-dependent methyltransferase [Anaerolineales bacterium]MCW5848179.1 class I SAM-dependent methyltransferase [Anaerolineae bacterium]
MDAFTRLILEAEQAHFSGWDFSFLKDRLVSETPPWDYRRIITGAMTDANSLLDMGTGGGEFLATLLPLPPHTCATEAYPPNIPLARRRLEPLGVRVVEFQDDDRLPLSGEMFDLIINRHESYCPSEVWRVLKPGGRFITQQVGGRDNIELNEQLGADVDPEYIDWNRQQATEELGAAGFHLSFQEEALSRTVFQDIGAVVYYLKAVPWQIPGFTVDFYRNRLRDLHARMEAGYPLVTHSHRFLIQCVKEPAG